MAFNLERFEYACYRREHEAACRLLLDLLGELDANYGNFAQGVEATLPYQVFPHEFDEHIITRITSAITCLFSDANLRFSPDWYSRILTVHRWLSTLFAASPYRNADHVIRSLSHTFATGDDGLAIADHDLIKLCMLYSPESEILIDVDGLFEVDKNLAIGLCLALISPRFLASTAAHKKRELILPWLTEKLLQIDDLEDLPAGILHDVYMHCSYADRPDKHDVKRSINWLIQKKMQREGLQDNPAPLPVVPGKKPVLLVVLEWFTSAHSIYRTHSLTMAAARDHFEVLALGYPNCVDEVTKQIFDRFTPIPDGSIFDQIEFIKKIARESQAQILYMPSIGMFPLTMYLANVRVAPIQAVALGHPATTHSRAIDYVVVEEDYVGDPACFSEQLLVLPKDGMPYRPSILASDLPEPLIPRDHPECVEIVLCSTTMKLNPTFLEVCREILRRSSQKIRFHFLIGQAQGLIYPQVERFVRSYLADGAVVYPHQEYQQYMDIIRQADMFINPFPFGNTNGIVDTVTCGLVGVCKTGREVHEHIDEGLFGRLGFPNWLVAHTHEEYIEAVIRLASQHEERVRLRNELSGPKNLHKIFSGRAHILGEKFLSLLS